MSFIKLKDRISSYQEMSDYRLMNKLPIIITINGRSFSKITHLLDKPYCPKFTEAMLSTTLQLCSEIEGTVFAYQHNDEITIIIKNDNVDSEPWCNNKIQKICSISSSVATICFNNYISSSDINIIASPLFISNVFAVPNMTEALNTIIFKQQQNFFLSVHFACLYELLKKYDQNSIKEMMIGLSTDEKIDLLYQECNVDFDSYPIQFRRGVACYKAPQLIDNILKNKWYINYELPILSKEQNFLSNILKYGQDIFRSK